MINVYLYIAFSFFVLNGIAYNVSIINNNEDPSLTKIFRIAFMYGFMAMLWPIELIFLSKLIYEEMKNG